MSKHIKAAAHACVTHTASPVRMPLLPGALVVVVVIVAYTAMTTRGITQSAALTGLAGAGVLGVRLASRLARIEARASRA